MFNLNLITHTTIAILTIINPVAAASIMVSMMEGSNPNEFHTVAFKATLTVVVASLITLFGGEFVFKLFGINIYSLKISGGLVLLLIAIHMAYGQVSKTRHSHPEKKEMEEKEDISIVPLGIPILFGPGLIATIIVLSNTISTKHGTLVADSVVITSIVVACIFTYLVLRYSSEINKLLGVTGMKILTRIMGLIVGAIAAQFLVSGIKALWG